MDATQLTCVEVTSMSNQSSIEDSQTRCQLLTDMDAIEGINYLNAKFQINIFLELWTLWLKRK